MTVAIPTKPNPGNETAVEDLIESDEAIDTELGTEFEDPDDWMIPKEDCDVRF